MRDGESFTLIDRPPAHPRDRHRRRAQLARRPQHHDRRPRRPPPRELEPIYRAPDNQILRPANDPGTRMRLAQGPHGGRRMSAIRSLGVAATRLGATLYHLLTSKLPRSRFSRCARLIPVATRRTTSSSC